MGIYIFLIVLIGLIYILDGRYLVSSQGFLFETKIRKKTKHLMIFFGLILFCVSAFRDTSVGIDTKSYLWSWDIFSSNFSDLSFSIFSEDGYLLLVYIFKTIGIGFRGIMIFGAAMYLVPVLYVIYKYSENPFLSLFYFITLDYYCFSMTGMRQCIAIGFCIIAFEMAMRKKIIPYFLFVFLAVAFHSTALVFVPVYFLRNVPMKKKYIFIFLLFAIVCFLFKTQIGFLLQSISRTFYENMTTGGTGMYVYMLLVIVLALFFTPIWNKDIKGARLISYMVVIAVIMYPVLQFNPSVLRLHYYYSIMMVLFIPSIFRKISNAKERLLFSCVFFFIAFYYFFAYTMQNMGVNPYVFGI